MSFKLVFLPEAEKDFKKLAGNERIAVAKALNKVLENPLPVNEGGYGKPLGNKQGNVLSGFLKIKIKNLGIRIVYKLIKIEGQMLVVVIGARADDEVYNVAKNRALKHKINNVNQNPTDCLSVGFTIILNLLHTKSRNNSVCAFFCVFDCYFFTLVENYNTLFIRGRN